MMVDMQKCDLFHFAFQQHDELHSHLAIISTVFLPVQSQRAALDLTVSLNS